MAQSNRFRIQHGVIGILTALLLQSGLSLPAFAQEVHRFEINTTDSATAIHEFGNQSGVQILASAEALSGKRLNNVSGELSTDDGLKKLLADTGLSHQYVGERAVALVSDPPMPGTDSSRTPSASRAPDSPETPDSGTAKKAGFWDRFRLAQNEPSSPSQTDSPTSRKEGPSRSSDKDSESRVLDEVVVTGSRIARRDTAAPVSTFDRADIDQLGISGVAGVLTYVPQEPTTDIGENRVTGGARYSQLRGLGTDTTLVLINGRRTAPSGNTVGSNAFDLNSIPLAAVERIEILSDSASAVYGTDAIGGVINVILKDHIPAPVVDLEYRFADGGAEERRVSLSLGGSTPRFRGSVVLDYFQRDFLLGSERELTANADFRRFGGIDRRSQSSNPGNVTSLTASNLPGLPSRFAAIPAGSTGVGLTPSDFLATAGQRNLESLSSFNSLMPEASRLGGAAFAEFDITPTLTAFGEVIYQDRETIEQLSPAALSGNVPAANPFNPFGTAVAITYLFEGIGPRERVTTDEFMRGVLGLRGNLSSWDWEMSLLATHGEAQQWQTNQTDPARVSAALASTNPSQALNVFQDGPGGSDTLLQSLVAPPNPDDRQSDAAQATAFLRGSLFDVPGGPIQAVIGVEAVAQDIVFITNTDAIEEGREAQALFGEVDIPLVGPSMNVPGMDSLVLSLAARYDHYSDFGDATNPQVGVMWRVGPSLLLRASYGTSFRAPSLFQLYSLRRSSAATVTDPRRGGQTTSITRIQGGNPDLEPINGESLTLGFVLTPEPLPGLRLSASRWQIELEDRVFILLPQVIVAFENQFPSLVLRGAPTPSDVAAGWPGQIQSVESVYTNFGILETSGIDLDLSYSFDSTWGHWSARLAGTWVEEWTSEEVPGVPPFERVGRASVFGTIPEWRAVASLGWNSDGLGLSVTARHIPDYEDTDLTGTPTGRILAAQTIVDGQATFDLDRLIEGSGVRLTIGAVNLFDELPQFSDTNGSIGYDSSQADIRGRFVYARMSKTF